MRTFVHFVFIFFLLSTSAFAQAVPARIGFAFPASGKQGTTVDVMLGGRQIVRAHGVLITGEGITGGIVGTYTSRALNNAAERAFIRRTFQEARLKFLFDNEAITEEQRDAAAQSILNLYISTVTVDDAPLPEYTLEELTVKYPYVDKLADPTPYDLQQMFYEYFYVRPERNPKESFAQGVLLRLTIAPDAPPGDRELRLITPSGTTAPIRFIVGTFPEVNELEPNDTETPDPAEWMPDAFNNDMVREQPAPQRDELMRRLRERGRNLLAMDTLTLPVVINGQIRAGDADQFRFHAAEGQKIVIAMQARYLIPYLADAVPGWFQGMLTLYGPGGRELANASSYRFEPDPLICFEIPEAGVYTLEVRDTLFRGRDDFVYRITIGEVPLVTSVFPLGGRVDTEVNAELQGWNLPATAARFDTSSGANIREIRELNGVPLQRPIRYAVDTLPEITAPESSETPTAVTLPVIVNGRIMTATGVDIFQFTGSAGDTLVFDVAARSLDSPLDAVLELFAPDETLLARNDDRADSSGLNIGLTTHHADPYLCETLPVDGTYTVRLYNAQQRGGAEYGYRLRIAPSEPGFAVYCTPSAIAFLGGARPIAFHAVRYGGFEGDISIAVPEGLPFRLSNNMIIPVDADRVSGTLAGTNDFDGLPQSITLLAKGLIGDREIVVPITACDSHEQAFIYHHLIPSSRGLTVLDGRLPRMEGEGQVQRQ